MSDNKTDLKIPKSTMYAAQEALEEGIQGLRGQSVKKKGAKKPRKNTQIKGLNGLSVDNTSPYKYGKGTNE